MKISKIVNMIMNVTLGAGFSLMGSMLMVGGIKDYWDDRKGRKNRE